MLVEGLTALEVVVLSWTPDCCELFIYITCVLAVIAMLFLVSLSVLWDDHVGLFCTPSTCLIVSTL